MGDTGGLVMLAAPTTYAAEKRTALFWLAVLLVVIVGTPVLIEFARRKRTIRSLSKEKGQTPAGSDGDAEKVRQDAIQAEIDRLEQQPRARLLGLIMGEDQRLSTSKAIALLWSLVIAYVLLALIVVWPPDWSKALHNLQGPYLALLGGPIAAVVLSKAVVSSRTRRGTLQKTKADGIPRLTDLVGDDSGDTDLFDVQYVLFNIIAVVFVLTAFSKATIDGFPEVPTELWLLTGGPAAVYVSNKAFGTNAPAIFGVDPARVKRSETLTVYGQNFVTSTEAGAGATEPKVKVQINGAAAPVVLGTETSTSVRATVPPDLPPSDKAVVTVITDAGVQVNRAGLLVVTQDPEIDPIPAGVSVAPGAVVTLTGRWVPGSGLTVLVDGVAATTANATCNAVNVTVPPGTPTPGQVDVMVIDTVGRSAPIKLTVR